MGSGLTKFIMHRQNALVAELEGFDGVELDVRSRQGVLFVGHDSVSATVPFLDYLAETSVRLLAVNAKEEGLIDPIRETMSYFDKEYFIFGCSVPELVPHAMNGSASDLAWRVSDLEDPVESDWLSNFGWVWLDYFGVSELPLGQLRRISDLDTRIVLASPELHPNSYSSVDGLRALLRNSGVTVDMVCTKQIALWEN